MGGVVLQRSKPFASSRAVPHGGATKATIPRFVWYVESLKERYILAMDEVDPLSNRREVAVRECKHLLVGFEANAL
jgi:hypothetical protein